MATTIFSLNSVACSQRFSLASFRLVYCLKSYDSHTVTYTTSYSLESNLHLSVDDDPESIRGSMELVAAVFVVLLPKPPSESSMKGVKGCCCCFSDTFCREKLRGKEWLLYFFAVRYGSVEEGIAVPISWNGSRLRILESTGGSKWSSCPIDDRLEVDLENAGETTIELFLQKSGAGMKEKRKVIHAFNWGQRSGQANNFLAYYSANLQALTMFENLPKKGLDKNLPWRPIQGGGIRLVWSWTRTVSARRCRRKGPRGGHHPGSSGWGPDGSHWSAYRRPVQIKVLRSESLQTKR